MPLNSYVGKELLEKILSSNHEIFKAISQSNGNVRRNRGNNTIVNSVIYLSLQ